MYKLICMAFDGEYVTEGEFKTIDEAWERSEDMGSRWFFYPFHFVLTSSGKTIADSPYGIEFLKGKRLSSVIRLFAETSKAVSPSCDVDSFVLELHITAGI